MELLGFAFSNSVSRIFFSFWPFLWFVVSWVFGCLGTSLPCIMGGGRLAGGGSAAVAVGVSDRWQVTDETRHMTQDTWRLKHNMWHVTHHRFFYYFFFFSESASVCFGFGATIWTCREIQCLPNAGFVLNFFIVMYNAFIHCDLEPQTTSAPRPWIQIWLYHYIPGFLEA